MRIQGQTPLREAPDIPEQLQGRLRQMWIESVDEYVAMLTAVDRAKSSQALGLSEGDLDRTFRAATSIMAAPRAEAVTTPKAGGPLGCRIDPETMDLFRQERKLPGAQGKIPVALARGLPPSVRLMDQMLPVKNQGERGTCVAFGTVALREFLWGDGTEFSEQFLYWACKELDGNPDDAGTWVHTAMTALATYGACRAETWPYNPRQDDDNEGQGPPPPEAAEEARQYIMSHARPVEPRLVDHYRAVLAGNEDVPSMPVTFATFVFGSWYRSAETHRTGKITMPFDFEDPIGGHAWCVVGYQDDSSVPGGGYFVVRNSWGADWAFDSPEAPGHAMMPYAYIELYALEAYSGEFAPCKDINGGAESGFEGEGEFAGYLRRLAKEQRRDTEGKLLPEGTAVLFNPLAPAEFMEDSPRNRQTFKSRDFTWSDALRQRLWFSDIGGFSSETKSRINAVRSAKERFVSAIHQNISSSTGMPFPHLTAPFWLHAIPYEWEPRIKRAVQVADLTADVVQVVRDQAACPPGLEWPGDWMGLLRDMNDVRVFAVERGGRRAHVVSAFVAGLTVQKEQEPAIVPPGQALIGAVQRAYRNWLAADEKSRPSFTFMTVGSALCMSDAEPSDAGDCLLLLAHPESGDTWKTRMPRRFGDRLAIRDFLDRLKPETPPERVSRIKDCVDALIPEGGNVTVEKVRDRTSYRRSTVHSAFLTLQEQAPDTYRLYKTSDGQLAVRRARRGERISLKASSFRRGFLRKHVLALLGAAIGVGGWTLRGMLGLSGWTGFVTLVLCVYITGTIQAGINRRASESEE